MNVLNSIGGKFLTEAYSHVRGSILGARPDNEHEVLPETVAGSLSSQTRHSPPTRTHAKSTPMKFSSQVKLHVVDEILAGTFDAAIPIDDEADDVQEIAEPQQKRTTRTTRDHSNSSNQPATEASSRRTRRNRVSSEERRLLGHSKYREPDDAVLIEVPTNKPEPEPEPEFDMAFKSKTSRFSMPKPALRGPFKPLDTLREPRTISDPPKSSSKNEHYLRQTRQGEVTRTQTTSTKRQPQAMKQTNHHSSPTRYVISDSTPPSKRRKTNHSPEAQSQQLPRARDVKSPSTSSKHTRTEKPNLLSGSIGAMYGMSDSPTATEFLSNGGSTPNRGRVDSPDDLMNPSELSETFMEGAKAQRRGGRSESSEYEIHPSRTISTKKSPTLAHLPSTDGPADKTARRRPLSIVTPQHPSKLARRLHEEGSPDALQADFYPATENPRRKPVLPTSPPEEQPKRFGLQHFINAGFVDVKAYEIAVYVKQQVFTVSYAQGEIVGLEDDALTQQIPVGKVQQFILPTDEGFNVVCIKLSQGVLPGNDCLLEFESQKPMTDFVLLLQQQNPHIRIAHQPRSWLERVISNAHAKIVDMSSSRTRAVQPNISQPIAEDVHDNNTAAQGQPEKRRKLIDRLDQGPISSDQQPQQRISRSKVSKDLNDLEVRTQPHTNDTEDRPRSPRPQRSRVTRHNPLETSDSIVIDREPRVQGTPWEKPLIYPPKGKKLASVTWEDLQRLEDEEYLNDSLISLFIRYLQENSNSEHAKRMHFFSSFFYDTLRRPTDGKKTSKDINYKGVANWTRNVSLISRDYVIVPVNESHHWYVMIICNLASLRGPDPKDEDDDLIELDSTTSDGPIRDDEQLKLMLRSDVLPADNETDMEDPNVARATSGISAGSRRPGRRKSQRSLRKYDDNTPVVITLDSLGLNRSSTATFLKDYLVQEFKEKNSMDIDRTRILGMTAKNIPQQDNWSDCGLYLCMYLEQFMKEPDMFVRSILQRDTESLKWPQRLKNGVLRQRMYNMLQTLHAAQVTKQPTGLYPIGNLLIRDEDYAAPKTKSRPRDIYDPEYLGPGLEYYDQHTAQREGLKGADREGLEAATSRNGHEGDEHIAHDTADLDVAEDTDRGDQEFIIIEDSQSQLQPQAQDGKTSRHFSHQLASRSAPRPDTPTELAARLRQGRSPHKYGYSTGTAIELDTPRTFADELRPIQELTSLTKQEEPLHKRRGSCDTDFLTGVESYAEHEHDEQTINTEQDEQEFVGFDDGPSMNGIEDVRQDSMVPESVLGDANDANGHDPYPDPMLMD